MSMRTYPGPDSSDNGLELSEQDLELVVGGLERVFQLPEPLAYAARAASGSASQPVPSLELSIRDVPIGQVALQY